ncbi:6925_t:CDS:2 [Cetraspora pellucida]|uniref:6925_t:CDS:1 n=1 Tax=Cetraspora pellucida TaxID=1433469 RepID=A0A9N9NYJ7_9GLOM|nr:6925_t:CDS:2 [Cetraspora pellucida]
MGIIAYWNRGEKNLVTSQSYAAGSITITSGVVGITNRAFKDFVLEPIKNGLEQLENNRSKLLKYRYNTFTMREIIIVKDNIPKIKTFLEREQINYEIQQEPKNLPNEKLLEYLETKSKENIFADYDEALKDKELEAEKRLLEEMDDEE